MIRALLISFLLLPTIVLADQHTIRLAIATSIENSGLLKHLLNSFNSDKKYNIDLQVVGSGKALRLGRSGDVDLIWVHSPQAEQKFINDGHSLEYQTVMKNNFVIIGPKNDPAKITQAKNVIEAFKRIAKQESTFFSRGDDSGTHKKEIALWSKTNINPIGEDWYIETGSGMAQTIQDAQSENAYMLCDQATFLVKENNKLTTLLKDSVNLFNPYSIILIKNKSTQNQKASRLLYEWLTSEKGRAEIENFKYNGHQLFSPITIN
ncbi:substrate-binding domain-containing protein [Thiomicrorhabdus lithotrophica]|uniref:Substrate-binding domain-containing protein n=1 Tax=Thiomicrorhabdus lithotrophica TaxID=2949997 RepID=A0ABY8CB87_9GAMM|nr:substrate-binding domain-containing protein [Thiomicrorhabdus lithotrophica]WEJ61831.1 substrate-binding domain-containing protein [Thiomicrorhabdus lithotrophica]